MKILFQIISNFKGYNKCERIQSIYPRGSFANTEDTKEKFAKIRKQKLEKSQMVLEKPNPRNRETREANEGHLLRHCCPSSLSFRSSEASTAPQATPLPSTPPLPSTVSIPRDVKNPPHRRCLGKRRAGGGNSCCGRR